MKKMTGTFALVALVLGAGATPATADCPKGTICRRLIEEGYKACLTGARDKWRNIRDICRQAKLDKNPKNCLAAIRNGFQATIKPLATCFPDDVDCGTFCCDSEHPVCEPGGDCCPIDSPDCCCPSDAPLCESDGFCHATTTTTAPPSVTTTTLASCGICNDEQVAGGDTPDTRDIMLGRSSGTSQFDFDTFSIPDQIIVTYEGRVLLDTGCVGTSGSRSLTYSGSSTEMKVEVRPNCQGGTSGTQWQYTLHCPQ
jgi:hypothetical protein